MKDFAITDEFDNDIRNSYMKHYVDMIVDEFLIYNKHLNINDFDYNHIVRTANDEMNLTDAELKEVISCSKDVLKSKYGIEIVSDNPIAIKVVDNE